MSAGPELPVVYLTKDRTHCARVCLEALLSNLSASGRGLRHIVCDDMSVPGHLDAVLDVYRRHGVEPSVHVSTPSRHGLGAIMNMGLDDAFRDPSGDPSGDLCLRIEDDWLLLRPLDLGGWLDAMPRFRIGSLRMGNMFRGLDELGRFAGPTGGECELWRVVANRGQRFTFNNQVAVVSREMCLAVGRYAENVKPSMVEIPVAEKYNSLTNRGRRPPYVAWPSRWTTKAHYGANMPFAHVGRSLAGHDHLYPIPMKYAGIDDPAKDAADRAPFIQGAGR